MNEQLLNFINDKSAAEGFAVIDWQYADMVNELVENELVELDPGNEDGGPIRVAITEDGRKWCNVVPTVIEPSAAPVPTEEPKRGRGRPRKEQPAMTVTAEVLGPEIAQSFVEELSSPQTPAWAMPPQQPTAPVWAQPSGPGVPMQPALRPGAPWDGQSYQPVHPVLLGEHVEDVGGGIVEITQEPAQPYPVGTDKEYVVTEEGRRNADARQNAQYGQGFTDKPAVERMAIITGTSSGVITGLTPPSKSKRISAKEAIAPYPFDTMAVNTAFYLTVEQGETFNKVLSAANRVYGKTDPTRRFAMFDAKKVPGAPTQVGYYVFRLE